MVTIHACAKTLLERAVNLSCVCACMCKLTKGGGRSTYFTGAVYCIMLYSGKLGKGLNLVIWRIWDKTIEFVVF